MLQGSAPRPMKKDLIRKLESAYATLAMLPAPSRLVEALFIWGDTSDKEVIVGALASHLRQLQVCTRCARIQLLYAAQLLAC